jgi:hypothetical protein
MSTLKDHHSAVTSDDDSGEMDGTLTLLARIEEINNSNPFGLADKRTSSSNARRDSIILTKLGGDMQENQERWRELFEKAKDEEDPQKRLAMTSEINQLLLEKERKASAKGRGLECGR